MAGGGLVWKLQQTLTTWLKACSVRVRSWTYVDGKARRQLGVMAACSYNDIPMYVCVSVLYISH